MQSNLKIYGLLSNHKNVFAWTFSKDYNKTNAKMYSISGNDALFSCIFAYLHDIKLINWLYMLYKGFFPVFIRIFGIFYMVNSKNFHKVFGKRLSRFLGYDMSRLTFKLYTSFLFAFLCKILIKTIIFSNRQLLSWSILSIF